MGLLCSWILWEFCCSGLNCGNSSGGFLGG